MQLVDMREEEKPQLKPVCRGTLDLHRLLTLHLLFLSCAGVLSRET